MSVARLRPLAEADLVERTLYCSADGGTDLGVRFFEAAVASLPAVEKMPNAGSPRVGELCDIPGLRGRRVPGFPVGWFYYVRPEYARSLKSSWRTIHRTFGQPAGSTFFLVVSARSLSCACVVMMRPLRDRSAGGQLADHRVDASAEVAVERSVPLRFEVFEIDSFERFYRSEYGPMCGLAYQLTGRRDVAEDLVQEGMLRAYREWGRISSYDRPDLWLRRAVVNLATSRWRRHRTAVRLQFRLSRQAEVPEPSAEMMEVWRQVRGLPRRQAEVVVLYYGCDLSVDDVAATLECAPGTVRAHLVRARAALAGLLDPEDGS